MRTIRLSQWRVLIAVVCLVALALVACSSFESQPLFVPTSAAPLPGKATTTVELATVTALPVATLPAIGTPGVSQASYKLGDVIDIGNLSLAVLGWSQSPEYKGSYKADPGKKFVLVDLALLNRGSRTQHINFFAARLEDAGGREYSSNGPLPFDVEFNPGTRARGQLPIQVPEASSDLVFLFPTTETGGDHIRVELGTAPVSLDLPPAFRTPQANVYEMGQAITQKDVKLAVLGWRLSQGNEKARPVPGTKLIVVDIVLLNQGSQALELAPRDRMTLQDGSLHQYEHDTRFENIPGNPRDPFLTASPGELVRFVLVFQVPEASGDYAVIYRASDDSESAKVDVKLSTAPTIAEVPAELSGAEATASQIGQIVTRDDLALAVLGWEMPAGTQYDKPAQGNKFVLVDVMVTNRGSLARSYRQMTLRDAGLRQYQIEWGYVFPDPFGYMGFPFANPVPPGERVRGQVAFQVPESSGGYVFAFDAAPNGGDDILVALGPQPAAVKPPAGLLAPNPNAHPAGSVIKQGNFALAVLGWLVTQGNGGLKPAAGHQFLAVDVMMVNRGSARSGRWYGLGPQVRDASGYTYSAGGGLHVEGEQVAAPLFQSGLDTSKPVRGKFVWEVRESSSPYTFIFDPKWLFGEEEGGDPIVVDLGARPFSLPPPSELLAP